MNEYGVVPEAGTVKFERVLPGPIERVWAYLSDSEKRGRWLASGPMELREGGRVTLEFKHKSLSSQVERTPDRYKEYDEGATMQGRVTAVEPPRLLAYTWGERDDETSRVTFELEPQGNEVLLTVTHRGLPSRTEMISVSGGWHTHLAILADELSGRDRRPFWSTHARLEGEYERLLENGPGAT